MQRSGGIVIEVTIHDHSVLRTGGCVNLDLTARNSSAHADTAQRTQRQVPVDSAAYLYFVILGWSSALRPF